MKTIADQLRERYAAPEWAIFFEVANGPGSTLRRYADAIAMSLFPSRGLDIHGFEVKKDRGDWLRELKDPRKAEEIAAYCDFWWIVVSDAKVAPKDEVPRNWGLLVSNGEQLRQVKAGERLEPKALDRKFVAAILRRAEEWTRDALKGDDRVTQSYERGFKEGEEHAQRDLTRATEHLKELEAAVANFEKASGVKISHWDHGRIGEAVKAFLWASEHDGTDELERSANVCAAAAETLRTRAAAVKAATEKSKAIAAAGGRSAGQG